MLSTFLTSGNLIDFLGHTGVSRVDNSIAYLDESIKFEKKGTTIEEFIQNVTRMQQKHRSSGLKLTSNGDKIFDKLTKTINLKLGFNTVQKILQSESFDLILSAVFDFFSVVDPETKQYFETIQNILQKGKRPKYPNTEEGILSTILFILTLCIPEINWISKPFKIRDDTDENPVNFFEFQFIEEKDFFWGFYGLCECDTCAGKDAIKICFITKDDKIIDNKEIKFTEKMYDDYILVLKKRADYFNNLEFDKTFDDSLVSKTLVGLYNIETKLYQSLYKNDFEHYKKEYFFRQYRKYCL